MHRMGFSADFIIWIKPCISRPWITPLVNGIPTSFFQASRGFCQIFLLSPFLYLIVVESLSKNLQFLQNNGELQGLIISIGVKNANHAQFADDTILLGGDSFIMAERFIGVISSFLKSSDGKINTLKSRFYYWNCPE